MILDFLMTKRREKSWVPVRPRGPGTMLPGPPWLNFRCILTPFNIIIAKWGDDRKSAFRLRLPHKKISGRLPDDRKFSEATGNWRFRLGLLRQKISGPLACMFLADVRQRLATLAGVSLPTGTEHQRSFTDLCGPDFFNPGG